MTRRVLLLTALVLAGANAPLSAYLKLGTRVDDNRTVTLRWERFPIRYFVTDRAADGVGVSQFQATIQRAFETWQAVENVELSSTFAGFTQA